MLRTELEEGLLQSGQFEHMPDPPAYLTRYKWAPSLVLRHSRSHYTVAFEIVRSVLIPKDVLTEAERAQREHRTLAVVLLAELDVATDATIAYCRERSFGLWVFARGVTRPLLEGRYETRATPTAAPKSHPGWIPDVVCDHASGLTHIRVGPIIKEYLPTLNDGRTGLNRAVTMVEEAVGAIIEQQSKYLVSPLPFYRFSELERLIRLDTHGTSEHVVHSFRTYVTGCVLIDHFWNFFQTTWQRYVGLADARIDDIWFLAAMFHDCGRRRHPELRKAAAKALEVADAGAQPLAEGAGQIARDEYQRASEKVGSLLAHIRRRRPHRWDLGACGGRADSQMQQALIRWYQTLQYHSVVSALDIAAEMIKAVRAASDNDEEDSLVDRAFLACNVFPAAAAIALHDWHLWEELQALGVFPFQARYYPLAALLIYLDTWDDYRRKEGMVMDVVCFDLAPTHATVRVQWSDPEMAAREMVKYEAYRTSVQWCREMSLDIDVASQEGKN